MEYGGVVSLVCGAWLLLWVLEVEKKLSGLEDLFCT